MSATGKGPASHSRVAVEVDEAPFDALRAGHRFVPAPQAERLHLLRRIEQGLDLVVARTALGTHAHHVGAGGFDAHHLKHGIVAVSGCHRNLNPHQTADPVLEPDRSVESSKTDQRIDYVGGLVESTWFADVSCLWGEGRIDGQPPGGVGAHYVTQLLPGLIKTESCEL